MWHRVWASSVACGASPATSLRQSTLMNADKGSVRMRSVLRSCDERKRGAVATLLDLADETDTCGGQWLLGQGVGRPSFSGRVCYTDEAKVQCNGRSGHFAGLGRRLCDGPSGVPNEGRQLRPHRWMGSKSRTRRHSADCTQSRLVQGTTSRVRSSSPANTSTPKGRPPHFHFHRRTSKFTLK
jgi:hypothetical protein